MSEYNPNEESRYEYQRPPIERISHKLAREFADAVIAKLDLDDPRFSPILNNLLHLETVIANKFPGRQREETMDLARDKLLPAIEWWAEKATKTFPVLLAIVEKWMWRAVNDEQKRKTRAKKKREKSLLTLPDLIIDHRVQERNGTKDGPHFGNHCERGGLKGYEENKRFEEAEGAVELVLKLKKEHGLHDFECYLLEWFIESWNDAEIDRKLAAKFGFSLSKARRNREIFKAKMRGLLHDKRTDN